MKAWKAVFALTLVLLLLCGCAAGGEGKQEAGFAPKLDTKTPVTLEIAGFMGNFEALDQVVNSFNTYYPNVTVTYESCSAGMLAEYLRNNTFVDIFMTDDTNLRYPDWTDSYVADSCADLSELDLSSVDSELLSACTFDGKVLRLPLGQKLYGFAVNKTLLERQGLNVPETYGEFLTVLEALKEKGYTPIQGSADTLYNNLALGMGIPELGRDENTLEAITRGSADGVEAVAQVFSRIEELTEKGYIDREVNQTYPADNYDGAILRFFEGDVPFWSCTTENFSGMKKREGKSDAFKENPFDYAFIYPPMGEAGADEFVEPWFGFSVNKNSDVYEYAMEFLRFQATLPELNRMASVKGLPTASVSSDDARFEAVWSTQQVESRLVSTGQVLNHMKTFLGDTAQTLFNGEGLASSREAAESYISRCKEVYDNMQKIDG